MKVEMKLVYDLKVNAPSCTVCPAGGAVELIKGGWECRECYGRWDIFGQDGEVVCQGCMDFASSYTEIDDDLICIDCAIEVRKKDEEK